ncbi:MAG: hypothetical protein AB7F50_05890 [Fimbriimonadaceae bacterium]
MPGAWTPGYKEPEPYYFSGTNARASGLGYTGGAVNGQTVYVVTAVPKLNCETVRTYQWQPGKPQVSSKSLKVMFDSSHFAHGSTVTVEFVFLDSLGVWRQDEMQAPDKNRLISYGHHDSSIQPKAAPIPVNVLSGLNYDTALHDGDGWNGTQFLSDMAGSTAVQIASHGGPGHFADDHDDLVYALGSPSVLESRMQQVTSGLPPFNVSELPPIAFAVLFCCCSGVDDRFLSFAFPGQNAYSPAMGDQAVVAFASSTYNVQLADMSMVLHEHLAVGFSVYAARQYVVNDDRFSVESGGNEVDLTAAHMLIYGDEYTRLKNVYLPNFHGKSLSWSRGL